MVVEVIIGDENHDLENNQNRRIENGNAEVFKWATVRESVIGFFLVCLPFMLLYMIAIVINMGLILPISCNSFVGGNGNFLDLNSYQQMMFCFLMCLTNLTLIGPSICVITSLLNQKIDDLKSAKQQRDSLIIRAIISVLFGLIFILAAISYINQTGGTSEMVYTLPLLILLATAIFKFTTWALVSFQWIKEKIANWLVRSNNAQTYKHIATGFLSIMWAAMLVTFMLLICTDLLSFSQESIPKEYFSS